MGEREELIKRIETDRGRIVDLCSETVKRPSPAPPGDTRRVAEYVCSFLDERGIKYEIVAADETMPNIVATVQGVEPGKHLVYNPIDPQLAAKLPTSPENAKNQGVQNVKWWNENYDKMLERFSAWKIS